MPFSINWNTRLTALECNYLFIVKKGVERTLNCWKNKNKIALMISHHLLLNSYDMPQILVFRLVDFSYFIHFNFLEPNIIIKNEKKSKRDKFSQSTKTTR